MVVGGASGPLSNGVRATVKPGARGGDPGERKNIYLGDRAILAFASKNKTKRLRAKPIVRTTKEHY